jgi:hypothetical protein
VFGWLQDSFFGIERESAYNLSVGYLKGAEQAGASTAALMLNVMTNFKVNDQPAERKQPCNFYKQYGNH